MQVKIQRKCRTTVEHIELTIKFVNKMEIIENKNQVSHLANKRYTTQEVERLRKIVNYVTIESEQRIGHVDYNNWTNHSEYSKGW